MDLREIDRLIAEKVMRWRLKSFAGAAGGFTAWVNDAGKIVKYENDCTLHVHQYDFWRPTINIVDAWQVVNKIKEKRFSIRERFIDELQKEVTPEETRNRGNLVDKGWMIFLMTPKDICLAALKAYGIEVEI